jgi:prepilin-type processing-associated H-X9-DG protein
MEFLLSGIPRQYAPIPYKAGHSIAWERRSMAGEGHPADGSIPQSPASQAQRSIGLTAALTKANVYGSLPDFHRYGSGKGQFMFVDGHVESLLPAQVKRKHLAVSY